MIAIRRRRWVLLLGGVSLALILIPSSCTQRTRLKLISAYFPFQRLAQAAGRLPARMFAPRDDRPLRRENDFLRSQMVSLQNERDKLRLKLQEVSNLRDCWKNYSSRLLHANVVIPADASTWRKSLVLTVGTKDGIRKGMPVLYQTHLVGRVDEAADSSCRVQLIIDPGFRAGAVAMPKTARSGVALDKRQVGVFEGTSGSAGRLKWILGNTPVENDDYVLTTEDPVNGIPPGLILGRVTDLPSTRGAYPHVNVEPVLNFNGLEQVTVLLTAGQPQ